VLVLKVQNREKFESGVLLLKDFKISESLVPDKDQVKC